MTLQEILDAVRFKYPNDYDDDELIKVVNRVQKELFRTIQKVETATQYDIVAGNPFYPIDFSSYGIIEVVVNGVEYPLANLRDKAKGRFYYISDGNTIGIYPTPDEDSEGGLTVFHYEEPATLSNANLSIEPDFDRAWHMILVYRVCKEVAESLRDTDMVNGFVTELNSIEEQYYSSVTYESWQLQLECGW